MKNSAVLGGCYPPRPSASVDNTLLDLQNSSYPTQPRSIIAKLHLMPYKKKQPIRIQENHCIIAVLIAPNLSIVRSCCAFVALSILAIVFNDVE